MTRLLTALLIFCCTHALADSCRVNGVAADCVITTSGSPPPPGPINGACGSAHGGSFAAAPTSGLCSAGTPSGLIGTGPWSWVCAGSAGGTSAGCSANLAPTQPIADCGMQGGDLRWMGDVNRLPGLINFKAVQLIPVPALAGSGDAGRAVQFIADAKQFPRGVILTMTDESQPTTNKDYVISSCAHDFTPVAGNEAGCTARGCGPSCGIALRFGPATDGSCSLTPGGTYYINFRDYFTPRGAVSSQFVIYNRTD